MERQSEKYILTEGINWEELGGGVSRKMLGYDNQIMMVLVKFEKYVFGVSLTVIFIPSPLIVCQENLNLRLTGLSKS